MLVRSHRSFRLGLFLFCLAVLPLAFAGGASAGWIPLGGEEGARKIFRSRPEAVKVVECTDILEDMDTPEAYQKLLEKYGPSSGSG